MWNLIVLANFGAGRESWTFLDTGDLFNRGPAGVEGTNFLPAFLEENLLGSVVEPPLSPLTTHCLVLLFN